MSYFSWTIAHYIRYWKYQGFVFIVLYQIALVVVHNIAIPYSDANAGGIMYDHKIISITTFHTYMICGNFVETILTQKGFKKWQIKI